ncbi:inositol monophosphatase family protein [Catellatospora tritici]|uniref:inositol monophosphatase family protein n=1 Tax=Catellatospora tritici TaxID=2851566 RepID=UPI001C2D09E9|nr:inositol monophosphatase [Catellatospora tritici]MBV1855493.1 inositol monophosphatase [Catellatospora tritici]
MFDDRDVARVEQVVRRVAAEQIMPRFGRLADAEVSEKKPGDLVTIADHAAERELTRELTALLPGSVVVGEEAVAADPSVLELLNGDAPAWIIDPIDGTANFVDGSPRFTVLVALAHQGELLASWTYAPALDLVATARVGGGAWIDGERVRVRPTGPQLRHLDVTVASPRWWTERDRRGFHALARRGVSMAFYDTTGLDYLALARGGRGAIVVTWDNPWDHAAGLLLVAEAGGVARTAAGVPFRLAGGNPLPLVASADAECTAAVLAAFAGEAAAEQPLTVELPPPAPEPRTPAIR